MNNKTITEGIKRGRLNYIKIAGKPSFITSAPLEKVKQVKHIAKPELYKSLIEDGYEVWEPKIIEIDTDVLQLPNNDTTELDKYLIKI